MRSPSEQLDIFADSAEVVARNEVLEALVARDAATARIGWQALADAFPDHPHLGCLQGAIDALDAPGDRPLADLDELARERSTLAGLAQAQPRNHTPAEQSMRLLLDLLALERQGRHHDLVQRRQTLRGLNESIYAIYLSTR